MLELFVLDAAFGKKVPAFIRLAKQADLAVEIIYLESARHSNANLLHGEGGQN